MNMLLCKLCSSTHSLICLFGGKSKLIRKYIQTITQYTIGIEFEKNDPRQYICLTCIIQVYNCYVFKISSLENDKKFKTTLIKNNGNMGKIAQEDKDKLPELDELKQTFVPWLLAKRGSSTNSENEEKIKHCSIQTDVSSLNMVNAYSQCEPNEVKHTFVQTDSSPLNTVNTYSQCEILAVRHKKQMRDKNIQTYSDNYSKACQTDNENDTIKTRDISSQTDDYKNMSKCEIRNGFSIKRSLKDDNMLPEKCVAQLATFVENSLTGCKLPDKTELKVIISDFVEDNNTLSKAVNMNIAEEKPILKCEESHLLENKILESDESYQKLEEDTLLKTPTGVKKAIPSLNSFSVLSPRSSGLLSVKDKVEHVHICSHCDVTLYSKKETKLHRRTHLKCIFCKKRCTSLRKVRIHMAFDCVKRPLPIVQLVPLEKSVDIEAKYPQVVERIRSKRKRTDSDMSL